jgi:hypothetical protein
MIHISHRFSHLKYFWEFYCDGESALGIPCHMMFLVVGPDWGRFGDEQDKRGTIATTISTSPQQD